MKKILLLFLISFLLFKQFSFAQNDNDTLELNLAKITNSDRIIILEGGFTTPSLDEKLHKNILQSCASAINCTVWIFEYYDTYDDSKLDEAQNLLKLSYTLLQSSRYYHETSEEDAAFVEKKILNLLDQFINKIKTSNESKTDRTLNLKIQQKYFHVSKNIGSTILTANVMMQVRAQTTFTNQF
ncbi:MAG: hypothetical protein ABI723_00400 [Bacteroidia bacterium]